MTIHLQVKALSLVSALLVVSALTPVVLSTSPAPPAAHLDFTCRRSRDGQWLQGYSGRDHLGF